jgi:hypothetical protein
MSTDYFAAPSDELAATALYGVGQLGLLDFTPEVAAARRAFYQSSPDEAALARVEVSHCGTLVVLSDNVLPGMELASLDAVVTGRTPDEVRADPRGTVIATPDGFGEAVVLTVSDHLRDALADLDEESVTQAAQRWAETFDGDPGDGLRPFVAALADLSRRAVDRGERLYCYVSV